MKKNYKLICILIISFFSTSIFALQNSYVIYIDAGSSGSRIHIFKYNSSPKLPLIKEVFFEKIMPGLSTYADNPKEAPKYLKKLLDDANNYLEQHDVKTQTVKIHLLATAGMRLLPENKQQDIYKNITNFLKNHYKFSIGNIETISGKMEGLYGWLAINYLSNSFKKNHLTTGGIEIGGASMQIVAATTKAISPDDQIILKINQQTYKIFSKSFLGLGQNEILSKMTNYPTASDCFPRNAYKNGNFNIKACRAIYRKILQQYNISEVTPPAVLQKPFVGLSSIYHTYHFFRINKNPKQALLESNIQQVCSNSWEQLQKAYPKIPKKILINQCANGVYIDELLYGQYKISDSQLIVADKINGNPIDWPLGAALYALLMPYPK